MINFPSRKQHFSTPSPRFNVDPLLNIGGIIDIFIFSAYDENASLYAFMHNNDEMNEHTILNIESGGRG